MNSIHPWFIIVGLLLFSFQRISLTILSLVGGFNCTIVVDFVKFSFIFFRSCFVWFYFLMCFTQFSYCRFLFREVLLFLIQFIFFLILILLFFFSEFSGFDAAGLAAVLHGSEG